MSSCMISGFTYRHRYHNATCDLYVVKVTYRDSKKIKLKYLLISKTSKSVVGGPIANCQFNIEDLGNWTRIE